MKVPRSLWDLESKSPTWRTLEPTRSSSMAKRRSGMFARCVEVRGGRKHLRSELPTYGIRKPYLGLNRNRPMVEMYVFVVALTLR